MKKAFLRKALVLLFVLCHFWAYPIEPWQTTNQGQNETVIADENESDGEESDEGTPGYIGIMPLCEGEYEENS